MTYYKVKAPNGRVQKFINTDDGFAEKEIADYWFEGCEVYLMQSSQAFKDEVIDTVSIDEIQERAA